MGAAPSPASVLAARPEPRYHPRAVDSRSVEPGEFWRGGEGRPDRGDDKSARAARALAERGELCSARRDRIAAVSRGGGFHLPLSPRRVFVRGVSRQACAPEFARGKARPESRGEPRPRLAEGAGFGAYATDRSSAHDRQADGRLEASLRCPRPRRRSAMTASAVMG